MRISYLLLLNCLIFFTGCASLSQSTSNPELGIVSEAKDWIFPVSLKKGIGLPKGFTQAETKDGCTLFIYEGKSYSDFTLTTHFKPGYGKDDFGGGLLFRYKDLDNYYCLRLNSNTDNLKFYKSIRGDRARFANRRVKIKNKNDWHELKVICRDNLLQAYVDNRLIFSRDDEIIKKGKVGLWLRGETPKTEFADLTIQP